MNINFFKSLLIILSLVIIPSFINAAPLRIIPDIIIDDIIEETKPIISDLKKELKALLSNRVEIKQKYILSSGWN